MLTVKKHIGECLYEKYTGLVSTPTMSASDFEGFLEYPPDEALGDLAFPCFKLSRELKMAPPAIAAKLCDNLGDDIIDRAVHQPEDISTSISRPTTSPVSCCLK